MEDLTGKQFGPYQIVAPLGEGGMAAVYKAYQPAMERYVALKVLPRHFADDAQFVARFQREAKLLAQLQHPHILPVFDYGQADGYTYIVMPFIQSGTLTDSLKGQPLPLSRIRQVISQVGDALNYAHVRGLIHRDVKPSNVLIDEGGNCLLTDFGLARMVETSVNLTASGSIMGTPAYMAPEQGAGQKIDTRSDIYSLGVIMYEMVTGRVPYRAETPIAVVFKHIQDPLPPARTINPELPETVELVILKALSKNPEDRYQTAGDMVRAVQAAISDMPAMSSAEQTLIGQVASTQPSMLVDQHSETQSAALAEKPKRASLFWAMIGGIVLLAIISGLFVVFGTGTNPASATSAIQTPMLLPSSTSIATSEPTVSAIQTPMPLPSSTPIATSEPTVLTGFNGYYILQTMFLEAENKCLEGNRVADDAFLGGATFMNDCDDVSGQLWKLVPAGDGYYILQTMFLEAENKCLEGNRVADDAFLGGATFMNDCDDVSGQLWKLVRGP